MIAGMQALPQTLYRAQQLREFDRLAFTDYGIAGYELMTRAGAAVLEALRRRWPQTQRITVVCGTGNNGGDGLVAARLAHAAGLAVTVMMASPPARLQGDALLAYQALRASGLDVQPFSTSAWPATDVIVDALFGTGLDRELGGVEREAVMQINAAAVPVLAVDVPSGLHADSGRVLGVTVRAGLTLSFIGLKTGMFTGDGPACCGEIEFDDLGLPSALYAREAAAALRILDSELAALLPHRPRTAHKGDHGHVLIVGGHRGMAGAARLAAEAALRVGAGLVSLATHSAHAAFATATLPEVMSHGVHDAHELRPLLARACVAAIGPGLGQDAWSKTLFEAMLDSALPLIVDADALNLLARDPCRRDHWVLTPHPGEAARLLGCTPADVQADRYAALHALQDRYGGTVVLKGAGSLIIGADGIVRVSDAGNPGMASGGMGDVLTGVIAGLVAQRLPLPQATWLGVHLHARAGDEAARAGERGLLASDLMPALRHWANPSWID